MEAYTTDCVKPEGLPIELADAVIRILDYCEYAGIDLGVAIRQKMAYNELRPYRHGGKKA
jgi:NTP pyrophosphatase (non-canonical NTP hydrolase)